MSFVLKLLNISIQSTFPLERPMKMDQLSSRCQLQAQSNTECNQNIQSSKEEEQKQFLVGVGQESKESRWPVKTARFFLSLKICMNNNHLIMKAKHISQHSYPLLSSEYKLTKILSYSYSLSDTISRSPRSTVYLGLNDQTLQEVAIKVIQEKSLETAVHKQLVTNQIRALRKLCHPNVLMLLDDLSTNNNFYVINQYCREGDLKTLLKIRKKLSSSQVQFILRQVCSGYKQLVDNKIVHRDLKPANILLHSGQCKISGFGFCKFQTQKDQIQYSVGSPIYMAPQAIKFNISNQKSDIWSIGIMGYQLLQGNTPFPSVTQQEIYEKSLKNQISFSEIEETSVLAYLIRRCLEVDPNIRIGVGQLLKQLQRVKCVCRLNNPLEFRYKYKCLQKKIQSKPACNRISNFLKSYDNIDQQLISVNKQNQYINKPVQAYEISYEQIRIQNRISYCRILAQVYKLLEACKRNVSKPLKKLISQILSTQLELLQLTFRQHKNVFQLKLWRLFLDSKKFNQLKKRYESVNAKVKFLKIKNNTTRQPMESLLKSSLCQIRIFLNQGLQQIIQCSNYYAYHLIKRLRQVNQTAISKGIDSKEFKQSCKQPLIIKQLGENKSS